MIGTVLTFAIIFGFFVLSRGFSVYIRRRALRNRGPGYRDGWQGNDNVWQPGGSQGHHGGGWGGGNHHGGGGWGGGDGGGHHGGGGGGGDGGGGGGHHG